VETLGGGEVRWDLVEVGDVLEWHGREAEVYAVLGFEETPRGRRVRLLCLWDGVVVDDYPAKEGEGDIGCRRVARGRRA
jgi:hypothetical protein